MPTKHIPSYLEKEGQVGLTEEEGRYWWDKVLSYKIKKKFLWEEIGIKSEIVSSQEYDELLPSIKKAWKKWLLKGRADKGLKLYGPSHEYGGIPGKIKETGQPIEVEGGEAIINKTSLKIKEEIVCKGTPDEIASKINELEDNGVSWNPGGSCTKTKENNMEYKEGDKISPAKAKKILHDGEINGKKLTEKQRKYFGARASGYPEKHQHGAKIKADIELPGSFGSTKKYKIDSEIDYHAKGAKIKSHLRDKKMSDIERKVIRDNKLKSAESGGIYKRGGYAGKTQTEIWNEYWGIDERDHFLRDHNLDWQYSTHKYDALPENVKQELKAYTMRGQYSGGGRFSEKDEFIRIVNVQEFHILEFLENEDFSEDKVVKAKDICVYKSTEGLVEFLDLYDQYYVIYENYEELESYLIALLPKQIKDKLKNPKQ